MPPETLPRGVVAFVSHVPLELGRVTDREFHRALLQAAAADGRRSLPQPDGTKYAELQKTALEGRLDSIWIQGQATEMHISVTDRRIARELERIKEENFATEAAYRRFLKHFRYTPRDVNERVELQLLSSRIARRVQMSAPNHPDRALEKFVDVYEKRWRTRTVCAAEYVIERCSNGPVDGA